MPGRISLRRRRKAPIAAALAAAWIAIAAPSIVLAAGEAPAPAASAPQPAPAAKPKVVAVYVEGTDAELVSADLVAIVPKQHKVLAADAFTDALAKAGQRYAFGAVLGVPKQRGRAIARIRKAAATAGADAVIVARVRHERGAVKVRLLYVDPAVESPVVDEELVYGGDELARRTAFTEKLRAPLDRLTPIVVAAPPPPPPPPPAPPPRPERTKNEVGSAIFVIAAGMEIGGRWFDYTDPITENNLRPYSGFGAPMPSISAEVYPLASTRIPIASDLGLGIAYAHGFPRKSSTEAFGNIGAAWDRVRASLRYRLRIDDLPFQERPGNVASSSILGLSGGIGYERFTFPAKGALAKEVPDASYLYLHVGIDGRFPVSSVAALVHASYLGPLSAGGLYPRFHGPSVGGFDVGGGLAVKIAAGFELRLTADYMRWFSSFDPQYADKYIAGGAHDELLAVHLGGAYAY